MGNRIAIVANSTWNISNFRLNLIEKLLKEGRQVIVIAPLDEYITYKEQFPTVKHIPLQNLNRDSKNPIKDIKLTFELKTIYKKLKPDLILHYTHKPNIFGGMAARMVGIKSMAVVTGLGYAFLHKGLTHNITKLLYRLVQGAHHKFIFENEDDKQLFIDEKIITAAKGISVNGCGVDINHFSPHPNGQHSQNGQALADPKKEKIIFTYIGRLLYDKGIMEFVQAAIKLRATAPNLEFWVVGELDESNPSMVQKRELLKWIDEGSIVYHGFVKNVKPLIAKSTCIVLPSYREGMPRIILEGMSMARPIITTRTAGCRQTIVEGKNGYLVDVKDPEDLAMAMSKFANLSAEEQKKMGEAGRIMAVEHFNAKKIAQDLFDIVSLP